MYANIKFFVVWMNQKQYVMDFYTLYDKIIFDVRTINVTVYINLICGGIMNQYFLDAKQKLKVDYNIDVIEDILLNREDRIILYADVTTPDSIHLNVISGSFNLIGLEDKQSYTLQEIFSYFE